MKFSILTPFKTNNKNKMKLIALYLFLIICLFVSWTWSVDISATTITESTTATSSYEAWWINVGSTSVTLTLPSTSGIDGRRYIIKRVDTGGSGDCFVSTTSGDNIETEQSVQLTFLQGFVLVARSASNTWQIVGNIN